MRFQRPLGHKIHGVWCMTWRLPLLHNLEIPDSAAPFQAAFTYEPGPCRLTPVKRRTVWPRSML